MNKNLDFLRAFAVLLGTVGHALAFFAKLGPYAHIRLLTLGGLGVLLFFVHTALVLMQSLEREPGAVSFLIRRIFRVYPLAMFAIGVVILFHLPQATIEPHHFSGYKPDFSDIIANLSLTQNFSLRAPILGPTWTLSYEMQMYIFLPLLFAIAYTLNRAFAVYLAVLALSLVIRHFSILPNLAFWAPCFLPGILAYQLLKTTHRKLPAFCWPIFLTALCTLYTMAPDSFYKDYALCAALGLAIPRFAQLQFPAVTSSCHYLAKYSYGIYLTHFAAIYFAFDRASHLPRSVQFTLFIAILAVIPILLYHTIESPMINLGKKIAATHTSIRPTPKPYPPPSAHLSLDLPEPCGPMSRRG